MARHMGISLKKIKRKRKLKKKYFDIILLLILSLRQDGRGNWAYLICRDKCLLSLLVQLANRKVVLQHTTQEKVRNKQRHEDKVLTGFYKYH